MGSAVEAYNARLEHFRYELKVPLEQAQYIEFEHYLRQLGLHPVSPYPERRVNSVYFDSHDFDDYTDNVSGIADRKKMRIRWYDGDMSRLTFEMKIKKNKASYKELLTLENPNLHDPRTAEGIECIMEGHKDSTEWLMLKTSMPVIEIQYDRKYFLLERDLRMTLDLNQSFRRLSPVLSQSMRKSPVFCVAEFKFPAAKRSMMQSMMRNIPFRIFRHSKYVIGMDVIAP